MRKIHDSFEDRVIKVGKRALELIRDSIKKQRGLDILLEVANIKCIEQGNMDESPVYQHKDFPNIVFMAEDEGDFRAYTKGKYDYIEKHKDMKRLEKIQSFLNKYWELLTDAFCERILDTEDYVVGELIDGIDDNDMEFNYKIKLKYWYGMDIPFWAKKLSDISVYHIKEEEESQVDFWKNNLKKKKEVHKINKGGK